MCLEQADSFLQEQGSVLPIRDGLSARGGYNSDSRSVRRKIVWKKCRKGRSSQPSREEEEEEYSRVYCGDSACMNREIHRLHMGVLEGTVDTEEVDRYIVPCIFLRSLRPSGCGGGVPFDHPAEGVPERVARVTLRCICGDPCHDVEIRKRAYCTQFPFLRKPGHLSAAPVAKRRRDAKSRNRKGAGASRMGAAAGVVLKMADMLPPKNSRGVTCFSGLPDTGVYIRAVMQKRYHTPHLVRHNAKCIADLEEEKQSKVKACCWRKEGAKPLADHVCCIIIQESILCLKRTKKTHKSPQFPESASEEEFDMCIRIMFGTLLKLYPLGAKRPIFNTR